MHFLVDIGKTNNVQEWCSTRELDQRGVVKRSMPSASDMFGERATTPHGIKPHSNEQHHEDPEVAEKTLLRTTSKIRPGIFDTTNIPHTVCGTVSPCNLINVGNNTKCVRAQIWSRKI